MGILVSVFHPKDSDPTSLFIFRPPAEIDMTLILVVLGFIAALVLLRSYRDHLALPPGPSSWPIVGSWLEIGGDLNHKRLAELSQKYGDIFMLQMGRRKIAVVSSPELAKKVLQTQGVEFASRGGNLVNDIFTGNGLDMVYTDYGDHWRKMRRIIIMAFCTNKVIQETKTVWEEEIKLAVDDLTSRRESFTSGVVFWRRLQFMVYNIMYRMMFNRRFPSKFDPLYCKVVSYDTERSRLSQSFDYNYVDFLPILKPFLKGYLKKCWDLQEKQYELIRDCFLEERRKILADLDVDNGEKCAIDRILRDELNSEIDERTMLYLIESINVQAINTILCSIEWLLAEIINNQDVQDKLRDELDSVLGEAELTEADLIKLPYLRAVVKESLRLHMPIPLLMPHMNTKQEKLGQYDIPAGTKVLINAWWIANNPNLWDEPDKFIPERFIKENIEPDGSDFRYFPFGSGRRCCPGNNLALPLLALIVGRMVQSHELIPGPGDEVVDMTEVDGQFRLQLLHHTVIRVRVRA